MEHGERQRNEHYGRSSSAILKNGVYHYEKELPQNLNCLLSWIYHAGNFCKFCTFTISYLSQNLPYFSWKNCVYLTVFFFTQLLVDLFCARYVDKIGYRRCVVASEILSACGLIGLAFLPNILPNAYAGILLSAMIYAAGSGLIEVLVSPIVEACPFDNKDSVMSLLHSFYCWGSVGVILLSTAFLACFWYGTLADPRMYLGCTSTVQHI